MKEPGQIEDYTYEKFILYLYLAAAYADFQIEDEEKYVIRQKMEENRLIDGEVFDKSWHDVLRDFNEHNDIESIEHIQRCTKKLKLSDEQRQKIYNDIKEIMAADGEAEASESVNLIKFKKLLDV